MLEQLGKKKTTDLTRDMAYKREKILENII